MPIRLLVLILTLNIVLASCSNDKTIHIKTSYAYGIGPKTKILMHGAVIGEITDLEVVNDGIVFEASIHPNIKLPKDSKCFIEKWDIFTDVVVIKKGKSKRLLKDGGTLYFTPTPPKPDITIDDETIEKAKDFIKEASGANQRDSVIRQLEELNKHLEEIDSELKKMDPKDH